MATEHTPVRVGHCWNCGGYYEVTDNLTHCSDECSAADAEALNAERFGPREPEDSDGD